MTAILATVAAVTATGALAHGAFHRNSPVFGRVLHELPGAGRRVSLTFDDGPNPEATPRVLDALGAAGVQATFFLLGRHVDRWPALAERIAREGHQVGNHGWAHEKLHRKLPRAVHADIARGTAAIVAATGIAPAHFRAPHGFRSPWVNASAHRVGQRVVGWSFGVWDSSRPGGEVIARRVIDRLRPRAIVLLHDGDAYDPSGDRRQTAEALPDILHALRERELAVDILP